jgi:purine-cytosine permease-like protein
VFDSPDQHLTWVGFAGAVTLMAGSSLTLVTSVADFCRYTPTRRDVRIGLTASALAAALVDTFIGGYAAAATGETNPFIALADLTRARSCSPFCSLRSSCRASRRTSATSTPPACRS